MKVGKRERPPTLPFFIIQEIYNKKSMVRFVKRTNPFEIMIIEKNDNVSYLP